MDLFELLSICLTKLKLTWAKKIVVSNNFLGANHFLDVDHNFVGPNFFGSNLFGPLEVKIFPVMTLLGPRFLKKLLGPKKIFGLAGRLD